MPCCVGCARILRFEVILTKIVMVLLAAIAAIQLIKPIGLPGLEHRRDAWKLAVIAFVIVGILTLIPAFLKS